MHALVARGAVAAAVTQPDRPAGRGKRLSGTPVKRAAEAAGIPVFTPERLREFEPRLRALAPDLCVVASYGRILPQTLLDSAPLWLNLHPSALPLYRGATPIQSAIRDGRTTTAVTVIAMDAGMDTGDILVQTEPIAIAPDDTYGSLHDRLAEIGAALLLLAIDNVAAGTGVRTPQHDWALRQRVAPAEIARTLTRPLKRDDGDLVRLATLTGARRLTDVVRSLNPVPCAYFEDLATGRIKVLRAHAAFVSPLAPDAAAEPGTVVSNRGFLCIATADRSWLVVDELVAPGGKPLPMRAYANGHPASAPAHLANALLPPSGDLLPR